MNTLTPANLRCEYQINPIGIDSPKPRLMWQSESEKRGAKQTAWHILAATNKASLDADKGDLWDSGMIESDDSIHHAYAGPVLKSRQRVYWKVRMWDNSGRPSKWSAVAFWEMGLLDRKEWQAKWIGSPLVGGPHTTIPAPYLRKEFRIDRKICSARLYVTALGLYEFSVNGKVVSEDVFRPGWTDYAKRVQYSVYDITSLLKKGNNAAGAILGDGWYCGHVGPCCRQVYGEKPWLLAQIAVDFEDGSTQWIGTDESWKTSPGPILEADMLMGESYDARLEMPGWSSAGFDDSEWSVVKILPDPGMDIVPQFGPPVRRMKELKSQKPQAGTSPRWGYRGNVYDLGQNMVGRLRIKVRGDRGATFSITHAEVLDEKGALYTTNLRGAKATDHYTLKGDSVEIWEPRFTFHGFRYVEISARQGDKYEILGVTGVVLHSDTPPTGEFECSNPLLNQLQHNIQWGQRGNFLEVPTDCPQRDERLGWMGDAQVFIRTAAYNMDVATFFTKWQRDITDAQAKDGAAPPVVPAPAQIGLPLDGGPAWADATVICPWTVYLCYGDTRILEEHYESLTRYVKFLDSTSRDNVRCWEGSNHMCFGDWLALDGSGTLFGGTPKAVLGTAFHAYSTRILGRIAKALGKSADAKRLEKKFEEIRDAFIREFVSPSGRIAGGTQTCYVLALYFDLLPAHARKVAIEELVNDIKNRGMHLSTGFVGTSYLPHVLLEGGRADIAFELLNQKTWPSWLYAVTQGATTIWERWDGWTHDRGFQDPGMNSFNHYAYGAIGEWLYKNVAGIDIDPDKPAYKHILMQPRQGGGLTSARGTLQSMHGKIVSDWKIRNGVFSWDVEIPANTSATVRIPATSVKDLTEGGRPIAKAAGVTLVREEKDACVCEIGSGTYRFSCRLV